MTEQIAKAVHNEIEPILYKLGTISIYENFKKIPWDELFSKTTCIDIIVHYFDTWINHHTEEIGNFFKNGRTIRIILPNVEKHTALDSIATRFPEYDKKLIRAKIENTLKKFTNLYNTQNNNHTNGSVTAYYVDSMIWYCRIRFGTDKLVLSPFEHERNVTVGSPAMLIPLTQYSIIKKWFDFEFERLLEKAVSQKSIPQKMQGDS